MGFIVQRKDSLAAVDFLLFVALNICSSTYSLHHKVSIISLQLKEVSHYKKSILSKCESVYHSVAADTMTISTNFHIS